MVEKYAITVDPLLHAEVLERYAALNLAPYKGFINPVIKRLTDGEGVVNDVVLTFDEGYAQQMMRYSRDYSFLPVYND